MFDNESVAVEYNRFFGVLVGPISFVEQAKEFREDMGESISKLESVPKRLELIPVRHTVASVPPEKRTFLGKVVFVVHGHDEASKESVSRFIERLGLRATILWKQPNAGRTIIGEFS